MVKLYMIDNKDIVSMKATVDDCNALHDITSITLEENKVFTEIEITDSNSFDISEEYIKQPDKAYIKTIVTITTETVIKNLLLPKKILYSVNDKYYMTANANLTLSEYKDCKYTFTSNSLGLLSDVLMYYHTLYPLITKNN